MKKTFSAIRKGDTAAVKAFLETHPDEIHTVAKQPPKKDDGQSLLQVALKVGQLDIANLLLDFNADVNFMESPECCNDWRMPVLHDAIRCAIMNCRWNAQDYISKSYIVHSSEEKADQAYWILRRMLVLGADVSAKDSYGNTCLERAILDARQLLPRYNYSTGTTLNDRMITDELTQDFLRIFDLLFEYGASSQWIDRTSGRTIKEHYAYEPVSRFIK